MSAVQRKSTLMLPLRIVFTQEGSSQFLSKNTKLKKMKLADNTEEFGIETNSIAPSLLQRMFLADYISKLEITMPEFSSSRQDILDLSKLTVYGVLYKQMDKMVLSQIFETEILKKYNRLNPSQMFDSKTQMSTSSLRAKMLVMESQYQRVKDEILKPVRGKILAGKDVTIEEKNVSLLLAEKYMDNLSLYTWYLILRFFKGDDFAVIQRIIQPILESFMDKSQIAEYIALMLMELAINSENNNFRKEAKIMYRGIMDETQAIYDPDIRKKIISEITRKREFVSISWRFGGGSTSIGTQNRLQIMLYNKEDVYDELKENIDSQKASSSKEKSLIDFYNTSSEQDDTSLGLYYLSYLSEACQKVNVKFDSLVNQFSTNDLTVITLSFNF
ncbi:MAG: hypothetical protein J6Y75_08730 [Spirochaetaceae bacterium]|nr:hypothetical protein [Spirochaetaceae bacterium]MBP5329963.1 hypothetical protein [Spirochaetaceae bacterium]